MAEVGEERLRAIVGCQKVAEKWRIGSVTSSRGLPENGGDVGDFMG